MATTIQPEPTMYATPERDGLKAPFASVHHVALVTNDMKKTVAFYRDVLGSEVALGHRMPRPGTERHYMITVAPGTVFAFFEFPDANPPTTRPRPCRQPGGRSITSASPSRAWSSSMRGTSG